MSSSFWTLVFHPSSPFFWRENNLALIEEPADVGKAIPSTADLGRPSNSLPKAAEGGDVRDGGEKADSSEVVDSTGGDRKWRTGEDMSGELSEEDGLLVGVDSILLHDEKSFNVHLSLWDTTFCRVLRL